MRQKEIAVRLSLGASRGQLVRQMLAESLVLSCIGGRLGVALAVVLTQGLLAFVPSDGQSDPDPRHAGRADPGVHARPDVPDRHRLRAAAGAAREPPGSVDDAEGHRRRDRGHRRIAVPAQGPGRGAGGAQLPAAVRRRPVRAQPAEPEDGRHRRGARQPGDVPALAGAQRLRQPARDGVLRAAHGQPARRAGRQVGGARRWCRSSRATSGTTACRSKGTRRRTARTCRRS